VVVFILLRDIDLDFPYVKEVGDIQRIMDKHSITEAEAIRFDYEYNWKQKRILFRDQVRCIASLYTYLLGRFPTESTRKLIINCMEQSADELHTTRDGYTEVSVELDMDSYFLLSNYEKKKLILEKIQEGVMIVGEKYSWDQEIFNKIAAEIHDRNYVNEYVWKQRFSPDRKVKAELLCEHDLDHFTGTLNIKHGKTGELIKTKKILKERPHELIFTQYLGELTWSSDRTVVITYRGKKSKWLVEDIK
jgi:hypothetical protein